MRCRALVAAHTSPTLINEGSIKARNLVERERAEGKIFGKCRHEFLRPAPLGSGVLERKR